MASGAPLQASLDAGEGGESVAHILQRHACGQRRAGCAERVTRVVQAGNRQRHVDFSALASDAQVVFQSARRAAATDAGRMLEGEIHHRAPGPLRAP